MEGTNAYNYLEKGVELSKERVGENLTPKKVKLHRACSQQEAVHDEEEGRRSSGIDSKEDGYIVNIGHAAGIPIVPIHTTTTAAANEFIKKNLQVMETCMENMQRTLGQVVPLGKESDNSSSLLRNNPTFITTKKATSNNNYNIMTKEEKAKHRENARLWHASCIQRKEQVALNKTNHEELKHTCVEQSEKILLLEAELNKVKERERKSMEGWDDILDNFVRKVKGLENHV